MDGAVDRWIREYQPGVSRRCIAGCIAPGGAYPARIHRPCRDWPEPKIPAQALFPAGSGAGTRTQNPLINSQMLCQLSYPGMHCWLLAGSRSRGPAAGCASPP
jgi:hypothetical protein